MSGPPGEVQPIDLTVHEAPAEARRWEARLGAGVGATRMTMLGESHRGVGMTIDLEALRWWNHVAAGVYVSELIAEPWSTVMSTRGKPIFRELSWEIEPEVAVRHARRLASWLRVGWTATGSAGVVIARTIEDCSQLFSDHACLDTLERSTELGASAGAAMFAHVGPVAFNLGGRAQTDTAGDAALAVQASAGAVW